MLRWLSKRVVAAIGDEVTDLALSTALDVKSTLANSLMALVGHIDQQAQPEDLVKWGQVRDQLVALADVWEIEARESFELNMRGPQ